MPKILKQFVPMSTAGKHLSNGNGEQDFLSSAIPVASLTNQFMKVCIYGQNRVGKTTLACEFPKPLLIISCEPIQSGGAASVTKSKDTDFISVHAIAEKLREKGSKQSGKEIVIDLARQLKVETKYKTVVLDGGTSLQDIILQELMGLENVPVQLQWGQVTEDQYRQRSEQTKEVLRLYMGLPKHVVILCKERDHNPLKGDRTPRMLRGQQQESFFGADLGAATAGWLHDACDYVCRLYIEKEIVKKQVKLKDMKGKDVISEEEVDTGRTVRRLRTLYHPNYAAGMRSASPECVPEFVEGKSSTDMYNNLLSIISGTYKV